MKFSLKAWSASTVGIEIVVAVVLGLLFGRWLDQRFGITWGTMLGLGLGLAIAVRALIRITKRMNRDD